MKRQLAKKIDKFKLGGTPNLNTVYINNLTKMLNNTVGNNQLAQAEYGMDMQFGDPTKPKKPQVTKPVQPYYTSDRKDYDYHVKEHDDSMKLYLENAIYQKSRNNQLEAYIDWSKKNNIYPKNTTGIVIDNKSKTIPVNWNTFNYTPLQNNLNQANQFNVVNKNIKPVKVGRTYVKDSKGNVAITDKHKTPLIVEYPIYKKPVQEVIFRANNNTIKKTLTPIPTKVKYVNKKKTITNVNAVPEDKVIPQDEITPLDPMSFPQVARPEQQIIPAPPYVKPVHYAGPRHGTWSDGSTGQFPEGLNTSDWERKTLEYQQQQRGTQPVVQTRKEGGEPDKTLPDEEWYKKYQQQKAKYESDKAKGIISSTGYQDEVTVTPANNNKPQFASKQLQKPGWQQAMDQSSLKVRNNNPDNFGPQSAGSADWFWTLPFAAPAAIEAAGAIGAMSLPFMSTVPGATVGNAAMAAGMANSFYKAPQNVKDWYDVSQGTKDWKEAAAGTGEIALGLIGSKAGFKSVADDVAQGAKTGLNYGKDLIHASKEAKKFTLPTYQPVTRWNPDDVPYGLEKAGRDLTEEQQALTGSWYSYKPKGDTSYESTIGFYPTNRPGPGNVNHLRLSEREIANLENSMSESAKGMSGKSESVTTSNDFLKGELNLPQELRDKAKTLRFDVNPSEYIPQSLGVNPSSGFGMGHTGKHVVDLVNAQYPKIAGISRKYFPEIGYSNKYNNLNTNKTLNPALPLILNSNTIKDQWHLQPAVLTEKFRQGGQPFSLNTKYINNLTNILNNVAGNNQLSQAAYGMNMQPGGPDKPVKPNNITTQDPFDESDYDYDYDWYLKNMAKNKIRNAEGKLPNVQYMQEVVVTGNPYPEKKPDMMQATPEQSNASRAWEYITNPLTAAEYAISGGGAENMPHNINEMRMAGIDPGVVEGRNLVGNTLNSTVNLFDAGDKVVRNIGEGNYGSAFLEGLRFIPSSGLLDDAIKLGVKPGVKYLGKTLGTETGLLSNTYKYNPWVFKPEPTSAYRMLGKEGLEDAQQSGVFRSNQVDVYDPSFSNKAFEETYYSQGVPFDAKKYKFPQEVIDKTSFAGGKNNRVWNWNKFEGPHMVEVTNSHDIANFNTNGVSPFENFGYEITTPGNAPLSFNHPNVNVYKQHWLHGYKKIPRTKWHLQPATIEGGFKNGGDVESWVDDLDDKQIKAYRKAGYIVKVIK